jgi:hypothetical protein
MSDANELIWKSATSALIPANASTALEIVQYAMQMSDKQRNKLVESFDAEFYDFGASFLWARAMATLKQRLQVLGPDFVGEMLDRPDLDSGSALESSLSDHDALRLAEDLGMFGPQQAMNLRHSKELMVFFASPHGHDGDPEMSQLDALQVLRACVESILGPGIDFAVGFADFRRQLEQTSMSSSDAEVELLRRSDRFFKSTTVRVLLALAKTANGAQLENVLANFNTLLPVAWPELRKPERWAVGLGYAEVAASGDKARTSGYRRALTRVSGFDFVPEDLRSRSFIAAAQRVIDAHQGLNNFYNEPEPTRLMSEMGSVFPIPAFPLCVSVTLCVKLGNAYGVSHAAQAAADRMLDSISEDRWTYYLDECLPNDRLVLAKLQVDRPLDRWIEAVVGPHSLNAAAPKNPLVQELVAASRISSKDRARRAASRLYRASSIPRND